MKFYIIPHIRAYKKRKTSRALICTQNIRGNVHKSNAKTKAFLDYVAYTHTAKLDNTNVDYTHAVINSMIATLLPLREGLPHQRSIPLVV